MPGVWDIINLSWEPIRLTNYNFHTHVQYCIPIHYHSCSIDKYRNVKDAKCQNFERLGISHLEKERICKTQPKSWESFLHILSPTWADLRFPYARELKYHLPFRGPIRLTNYNFHTFVQCYITFHYHSCSIDKYRNVKDAKCQNFGRLGISHLEKERIFKTQPKSWENFLHIPAPARADLRFPLC